MSSTKTTQRMVLSAMFLALALLLPFLTLQISSLGNALCPMHLPVLLCGFFCGPWYALGVGFIAPYLRFALFGMPTLMPTGLAMSLELATYGLVVALMYKALPKKTISVYISLITAMITGRLIWGLAMVLILGLNSSSFGWPVFITNGFFNAIPGIIVQIVLIPIIVFALKKFTFCNNLEPSN